MSLLPAGVRTEFEGLPAARGQRCSTFPTSLRLDGMARLAATGAQPQPQALKYVPTAGALRVLAAGTEALGRESIVQPHGLLPRDDRRGVEGALGQAANLENP